MGKITDEIGAAIRSSSHMLSSISNERLRDEFLKGVSSAQSVAHFLNTMAEFDLFQYIFPNTSINSPIEERDPVVLIAWLLLENGVDKAGATLQSQKYTLNETKAVKFLIGLRKLSVQNAFVLKKAEANAAVSPEQIERFGQLIGLPNNMLRAFMEFRLTVTGASLPDVAPGPEMGVLIKAMETKNFEALM